MSLITAAPFALDVKAVDEDGTFSGYASVFDVTDLGRDVVKSGAFRKSLKSRPAGKVKMLREHDMRNPVGIWTGIEEDAKGLKVTGRLILGATAGRDAYELMKAGALDGLSIGFRTIKDTIDRTKGVRILHEIDLHEISIVSLPMNPAATVTTVKAFDPAERARLIAEAIHRARRALRTA